MIASKMIKEGLLSGFAAVFEAGKVASGDNDGKLPTDPSCAGQGATADGNDHRKLPAVPSVAPSKPAAESEASEKILRRSSLLQTRFMLPHALAMQRSLKKSILLQARALLTHPTKIYLRRILLLRAPVHAASSTGTTTTREESSSAAIKCTSGSSKNIEPPVDPLSVSTAAIS